ncbi:glycoside hydrolase family 3 C-terminal domain-containing protein [Spirochaeta thermophila]|nr:glycoside hydrolase family 3 C-terminal domain-containing protein [Spirochaeta thermophila]
MQVKDIVARLSLEQKAALCSGKDFWFTVDIPELGVRSMLLSDGPHGLRKMKEGTEVDAEEMTVPAVCFPSGVALASSWDRELLHRLGRVLGEEARAEGIDVLLGPAINIKRSPLCGRNFEYYSEDPYLAGELAAAYIRGVQEQGVGTSVKHYVANNQEHRRMSADAVIDERALREIYLAAFERAVKGGRPWTVMAAYNRVNGAYCTESSFLLTRVLREEWGFDGFVMSDWGAVDEIVEALKAGMDLEMPSSFGVGPGKLVKAVKEGRLSEEVLDRAVERILGVLARAGEAHSGTYDKEAHHRLARETARECMVLLKNEEGILPLEGVRRVALVGAFARHPRFQGGGSSHINAFKVESLYAELPKVLEGAEISYVPGYVPGEEGKVDERLIQEACEAAKAAEVAVVCVGLPEEWESEGYDREHLELPESHNRLVEAVAAVQPHTVVVLHNGAPVRMPWLGRVKAVLEAYLGGQGVGGAVADILAGVVSPSGKLAETFPQRLEDTPCYLWFPGERDRVEYREGIFVGYRYYDTVGKEVLFPFGFGLSYTEFAYTGMKVSAGEVSADDQLVVEVSVKNVGKRAGKEVVQLYVRDVESSVVRPEKELKGFEKVFLEPGEEKTVRFTLDRRAFAYYEPEVQDWVVEEGEFEILVGASSRDIRLSERVTLRSNDRVPFEVGRNTLLGDLLAHPATRSIGEEVVAGLTRPGGPMEGIMKRSPNMAQAIIRYLPLRDLVNFSGGAFTEEMLTDIIKRCSESLSS